MKNIIVSGCSYSQNCGHIPYPELIKKRTTSSVTNLAWPGQGNDSIIRIIKEQIEQGAKDTLFICQLSYLHRISLFCNANQKWTDFQPNFINEKPQVKDGNIIYEFNTDIKHNKGGIGTFKAAKEIETGFTEEEYRELMKWYETYLKIIYDENHRFESLIKDIDSLNYSVENSGNKIIYLYWSHEIVDIDELKKRNFFNIDGEYSMLKWSIDNEMISDDSHLNDKGHTTLTELLIDKLNIETKENLTIL